MHSTKHTFGAIALTGALFFGGFACGGSGGSKASFCSNAKKFSSQEFDASDSKDFMKAMEAFQSSAPSEIKSDVDYLADWSKKMQNVDSSDPSAAADAMKGFDEKKLDAASDKIDKYLKDECGIEDSDS